MKIHHVGVICKNLKKAVQKYKELGYVVEKELITDHSRNLDYIFINNNGNIFELISKHDENKPCDIDSLIKNIKLPGNYMYHTCYESKKLEEDIERFKAIGYKLLKSPQRAKACAESRVAFLMHVDIGIVEFIEV